MIVDFLEPKIDPMYISYGKFAKRVFLLEKYWGNMFMGICVTNAPLTSKVQL